MQLIKTIERNEKLTKVAQNVYTYDGAGDNISRVEDGVPVYYVYDGNTVILELDGNGAEKARNVYGRNLIAREVDGVTAIYRYNGHGDVITIMGTDGNAISSYEYDEFGNETASTGTFDNPYRYAGYEYLDEVELYDLNARYYDPSIARFLTEDPYYNLGNRVMGVYEMILTFRKIQRRRDTSRRNMDSYCTYV